MTIENQSEKLFGVKRGVSKVLSNNADVPFVDRINNYQDYPMPASNKDGTVSTHLLSAELDDDGIAWVFPNKVLDKTNNTYTTYDDNFEALAIAKESGNAVRFNTIKEAELFSKSYKNDDFNKYYNPSEKERGKTFEGSGANIVDTAKQAYKGVLNVIEESSIPLFGKDSLGTDTLGKVADAIPLVKSALSPEDSVEKRREEIEKLSQDISDRTPDNLTLTQQGFRAALESAPLTAVAMVTSIFGTPAAGLTIMGGYTGALEYNEAREKGKTFAQSLAYGTVQGSIEAFTERLGLKPLMRMFKNKGDGFMQDAIAYGTRELIGENAAEFGQSMTAWYAGLDEALMNPDLSKTDKLILQAQRQYVASVAALSMSGTTTTATAGVRGVSSQLEDNNAPKRSEGWVKTRATYTRKDKDGNEVEKETGADVYTRIFYNNGEIVPAEEVERTNSVKQDNIKKAPANEDGMYSKLQEAIINMRLEMNNPQDVMNYFKNRAVVWAEMRDSGMLTFLQDSIKEGKPVTRTELMKEFNDNSIMKSYRRETLTPSSVKETNVFDLLPESDIIAINEYGLEDEANRDRANGRSLNEQEKENKIADTSYSMYSAIVRSALNRKPFITSKFKQDEDSYLEQDTRERTPAIVPEAITSDYNKEEIFDLVMKATVKANQDLITNPTSIETPREEGKKALENLLVRGKEQGYVDYEDMVELLPEDYLDIENVTSITKVLDEIDIVVPNEKDLPTDKFPLFQKNKQAQIEYIEKYLPEDLKNDLDFYAKETSEKYLEQNPEYTWNVDTDEFSYNVTGYNGAYTLTIALKADGDQPAKTVLVEDIKGSLEEVEVRMKRYDQGNSVEPVTLANSVYGDQRYNSPNFDENTYKETIIVMDSPDGGILKGGYPYSHFSSIDNTVLHLRTTERIDERGKKILYIEEMQSDWLEAGERVITDKSSPNYGMPEFGWRDPEKFKKLLTESPVNAKKDLKIVKESIADIKKSLKKSFPSEKDFKKFLFTFSKAQTSTNRQIETTLKSIYFDEEVSLQDLANISGIGVSVTRPNENRNESYALNGLWLVVQNADAELYRNSDFYEDTSLYNPDESNTFGQLKTRIMGKEQRLKLKKGADNQNKERRELEKQLKTVPTMPAKEKWHEFGMRVAVNMAIEGGFDRVAWSNSDEQVRRWGEGRDKSVRYNEAAGKVIKTKVPEGVNKKMFVSLYDKKLPSYAQRLANQYNSKSGKAIIDFDEKWSPEERKKLSAKFGTDSYGNKTGVEDKYKNSYLDISPEMVEAFKSGRVKFYRRGGLVSQEELKNAGRKITQGMRNKKWAEYLLELERQKDKKISPGWQGYRRRYAEGGEVTNPIDGLRDYILSEIDGMKFNFAGKIAKGSIIKAVNKSFADLGTNPSREQVENLWLEQSANLDNLNKILKNPDNQAGIKERITDTYNKAYDSQFNLDIPTTEATKLAETGAVAAGGGVLGEWFNRGKNVRIPGEDKASWKTLGKDSLKQLTRSDAAFKAGKTGLSTLRPLKAFTPSMFATGPDPLTRQLVGRSASAISKASPYLSLLNPGTAQAPSPEEMYGIEFGTPEYYSSGVSFNDSLLSNKRDRREDRINRTNKMEELRVKNAQAVAQAKARDEAQAKQEAQQKQKTQEQKVQKQKEKTYSNVTVDNKGSKGYTGQGSQSRAGNRTRTKPTPSRGGSRRNYGVTGKLVTGGR